MCVEDLERRDEPLKGRIEQEERVSSFRIEATNGTVCLTNAEPRGSATALRIVVFPKDQKVQRLLVAVIIVLKLMETAADFRKIVVQRSSVQRPTRAQRQAGDNR